MLSRFSGISVPGSRFRLGFGFPPTVTSPGDRLGPDHRAVLILVHTRLASATYGSEAALPFACLTLGSVRVPVAEA